MSVENGHFFEFGAFRLDTREKMLLCGDQPVPVTPKVFETLQVFVENPGRLMEKDELMEKIWPDRFVEEGNIAFTIKTLRRVLKDDAHHPHFIETVPRRGYRFIAEVKTANRSIPENGPVAPARLAIPPSSKRSLQAAAALAILLVGAVAAFFFAGPGQSNSPSSAPILAAPLKYEKFEAGGVRRAVISPNGKYVAYATETGGKESLWLRRIETSENIQIVPPTNEEYQGLTISHDGNSLYFVRKTLDDLQLSAIYRVSTFGGIPVKIADKSEGQISVSPDDKQVLFTRCSYKDEDFCSLMLVDADGGNERALVTRPRPTRITDCDFSPDGKSIAFASGQSWTGGSDFRLMLLDIPSGEEKQISAKTFFIIHHLQWLPDSGGLLMTARDGLNFTTKIWHVEGGSGTATALTDDATDYHSISLDAAAGKIIATRASNTYNLYIANVNDLSNARGLGAAQVGLAFSSGAKIVYEGNDGDIWSINSDGGERRQLTNNSFVNHTPRVSPDGRYIFFTSTRTGSNQIWRMNPDGGGQTQITRRDGGYPKRVTADGKWLYYESGLQQTLWRISTEGGDEEKVSELQTPYSAVSPDGDLVSYATFAVGGERRASITVMSIEQESVVKTLTRHEDSSSVISAWDHGGKGLYYVASGASGNTLWYQPLDGVAPRLVGNLGADEIAGFALSPDGSNIAFIRGRWVLDAVLIEGLKTN
ncbi:MAG: winged helix-turn-helix domain-containing protein [Pyrinomonadaceae bacterium]